MSITNSKQISDVKVLLKTGIDGSSIESVEKTETIGLVDIYTITLTNGEKTTFEVTNGNGIESVEKTGTSGLVDTYTITFEDGSTTTFQVTNGADTNAQIAERVESPATKAYSVGDYVVFANALYKVIAPIASGSDFIIDTNIQATEVMNEVKDRDGYIIANTNLIKETAGWSGKNKAIPTKLGIVFDMNSSTYENAGSVVSFCGKIDHNKEYTFSHIGGNRFRLALSVDYPANGVACTPLVSDNNLKSYTFNSGNYNYACMYCDNTNASVDTIKPMLRDANIIDDTYEPYRDTTAFPRDEQRVLGAKNYFKASASSQTISGVAYTVDSDGVVTANNTATATSLLLVGTLGGLKYNTDYILSGCAKVSGIWMDLRTDISGTTRTIFQNGVGVADNAGQGIKFNTSQLTEEVTGNAVDINNGHCYLYIRIPKDKVCDNFVFKPMIRLASDPDDTFAPFAQTNKVLTDEVGALDTAKQSKTLDTPIIIGGASRTTVETALGALNNVMNNDRIIGKNVSINTSYGVGYPKYYKIFEVNISGNSNAIPLRITGEIGNKDQWTNATFDISVDIHTTYGGYIYGNVIGKDLYGYFPSLFVTIQSSTIRVYVYLGYSGAYFKANVFADVGTVYTNPTGEDSYAGTIKSRLSELIASDLGSAKLTWLDSQSTYFDEASHKCKIYRYDNTRFMCVIDVQQNMSTHNTYQPFIRFDPVLLPAEFKNRYEYEDVSGSKFDLLINENGRTYINGLETGHIFLTLIF